MKFDIAVPPAGIITGFRLKLLVVRPAGEEGEEDNVTVPAKLLKLVSMTVELECPPDGIVRDDGLDEAL